MLISCHVQPNMCCTSLAGEDFAVQSGCNKICQLINFKVKASLEM